jgi:Cu/Ag efflux pump CusA
VTLAIIFLLLYLNFRSITETMIVMLSPPFALVGGLWLMWWLGFNLSVAVGFIALAGGAAETGVVMQRIAVPMIGGMPSSTLLTLIVIPAIFGLVKGYRLRG